MANELKPFKVLTGCLYITRGNELLAVAGPGDIVKDADHLAALGAERIAGLIKQGSASMDLRAAADGAMSASERERAFNVVGESLRDGMARQKLADARRERAEVEGTMPSPRELPRAMMPDMTRG
jgi:hypothetical protein